MACNLIQRRTTDGRGGVRTKQAEARRRQAGAGNELKGSESDRKNKEKERARHGKTTADVVGWSVGHHCT